MQYAQKDMHIFEHYWFISAGAHVGQPITLKSTSASYLDVFDRLHFGSRA